MQRYVLAITGLLLATLTFITWPALTGHSANTSNSYPVTAQVYFSPHGGCTDAIVGELAGARKSVLVQAYEFTSAPIAKALMQAHKRGVDVRVILDRCNRTAKYSAADFLVHAGIPTWIDTTHPIAHSKVMVIDAREIITGSFNFTRAAEEKNLENLLILRSPDLAARYAANWQAEKTTAVVYTDHQQSTVHQEKPHATVATAGTGQAIYIGNTNSKVFHRPTCAHLPKPENQIMFHSREAAIQAGYHPCKICNP